MIIGIDRISVKNVDDNGQESSCVSPNPNSALLYITEFLINSKQTAGSMVIGVTGNINEVPRNWLLVFRKDSQNQPTTDVMLKFPQEAESPLFDLVKDVEVSPVCVGPI